VTQTTLELARVTSQQGALRAECRTRVSASAKSCPLSRCRPATVGEDGAGHEAGRDSYELRSPCKPRNHDQRETKEPDAPNRQRPNVNPADA